MRILDSSNRMQQLARLEIDNLDTLLCLRSGKEPMSLEVDGQMIAIWPLGNVGHDDSLQELQRRVAARVSNNEQGNEECDQNSNFLQLALQPFDVRLSS